MSEAESAESSYREIVTTLKGLKKEVSLLQRDVHEIMEYLHDSQLSKEEHKLLRDSIRKTKAGDFSGLVPWEKVKKSLKQTRSRS